MRKRTSPSEKCGFAGAGNGENIIRRVCAVAKALHTFALELGTAAGLATGGRGAVFDQIRVVWEKSTFVRTEKGVESTFARQVCTTLTTPGSCVSQKWNDSRLVLGRQGVAKELRVAKFRVATNNADCCSGRVRRVESVNVEKHAHRGQNSKRIIDPSERQRIDRNCQTLAAAA